MKQDNKVVSFSGQKPFSRFDLPPALVRLRDTSGQSLKDVLGRFFDRADDALFELADRAGSNTDQTVYFDAMRELRLRRKAMAVSVLQYVSQAFNDIGSFRPRHSGGALDDVDQDSLSLVEHSDLEQQVAIDNLINKLRSRYQAPIQLLSMRVNHLVPGVELADNQMPLSPEVICGGVAEACADLDIDIRAKLVVLKLFDRLLADTLGDFYQEANRTLVSEGVLPDVKRPMPRSETAGSGARSATSAPVPPSSVRHNASGETGGFSYATFSELSALLHQRGNSSMAAEPVTSGEAYLDTDMLMARLSEAQASFGRWEGSDVVSLDQQLQPVLQAANGQKASIGQVDSDVINLVSMLFDFILEDRQLHPVMKALIGRLQIPVLKVALSDKNFFNRGGHPVRKLLNELALSAIGWNEKRQGQRDPLREKIESVVDRVLSEFTNNVSLFEELLKDFTHFTDLDRRRRELVEQRLRDAEEGRARQERACQLAESLVKDCTSGRDIPESVLGILNEAWMKYLQWVVLREGEDSERWADASELTGHLVWSVDPQPVEHSTRSELLRAIPAIVDDFRLALQEISWDPFATDAAVRDLELAHVDVFQRLATAPSRPASDLYHEETVADPHPDTGTRPETSQTPQTPAPEPEAEKQEPDRVQPAAAKAEAAMGSGASNHSPEAQDTEEEVSPHWLEQADSIRVGAWIELTRDDSKLRCKLAAFIKATGKYIFVNRSGAKVAEYHRQDLAVALASGAVSMLDDGLIFDRALESIIDNLRSSRKD
ncbi:hypothetical protein GCM10011533_25030 [Streptosporangium jomthongense]|uniref:DUF1631 domain-containing protein n=1 Tax=Marinobacter aromaticivorans TaxID=1494078 RepID=A0ABW2IWV6_9GAMM|nr:DUF1631 domain-containing protein [Marinobacter aromaticivorans]GGE71652.1 hypothetical protein GCM10011533_25030 [Streptosporangium jomthongense]